MATKDKNTKKSMEKKPAHAEREAARQEGQEVAGPVEQPALPEVRWLPGPPQPRSAPEQS